LEIGVRIDFVTIRNVISSSEKVTADCLSLYGAIHEKPLEHLGFVIDAVRVSDQCYGDSQLLTLYGEPSIKSDQHSRNQRKKHDVTDIT
jgi:hypothetical protein